MYQDEKLPPSNYAIIRWFGFDQFIPEATVTSYWMSSKAFFIIRFIITLYSTIVIWTYIGVTGPYMKYFFDMFTHLTFIGLHAYLVTSTVYHFRYLHSKSLDFYFNQFTILNYLYVYLYHTVITFNIVTPVVYWSILHGSATSGVSAWINTSVHGVSFFLMIFDVILSRQKVFIRMILPVLFTVILYMCMTFIIHTTQGFWVYPFLDWSQGGRAAIWYVAVGLIVVASFFIQWLIHFVRDFVARKTGKQGHAGQVDAQSKLETSLEEA